MECRGDIQMNEGIELVGQTDLEVMAEAFGLGTIDHSDGALQARLPEIIGQHARFREIEDDIPLPGFVQQGFPASR